MLEGEMFIDPRVASPSSTSGSSRRFLNEHPSLFRNAKVLTNVAKASSDDQSSGSSDHSSPDIGHLFSSSHTTSRTSSPSSLPSGDTLTPEPNVDTPSSKLSFEALKAPYKDKTSYTHASALDDTNTAGKHL
jgi:hypothetical protein